MDNSQRCRSASGTSMNTRNYGVKSCYDCRHFEYWKKSFTTIWQRWNYVIIFTQSTDCEWYYILKETALLSCLDQFQFNPSVSASCLQTEVRNEFSHSRTSWTVADWSHHPCWMHWPTIKNIHSIKSTSDAQKVSFYIQREIRIKAYIMNNHEVCLC